MNGFDIALIAVVALSTLFAFARGVVREVVSLVAWVAAFVLALAYAGDVAGLFSRFDITPVAKHVVAFALIAVGVLIVGALIGALVSKAVRAVGLGFVDRALGALFGLARGVLAVVGFALVAGVTALPKQVWWQNAMLSPYLAEMALSLRGYLPKAWADRMDFSPAGSVTAGTRTLACGAGAGEA